MNCFYLRFVVLLRLDIIFFFLKFFVDFIFFQGGHLECVKLMLMSGANVNQESQKKMPIDYAKGVFFVSTFVFFFFKKKKKWEISAKLRSCCGPTPFAGAAARPSLCVTRKDAQNAKLDVFFCFFCFLNHMTDCEILFCGMPEKKLESNASKTVFDLGRTQRTTHKQKIINRKNFFFSLYYSYSEFCFVSLSARALFCCTFF